MVEEKCCCSGSIKRKLSILGTVNKCFVSLQPIRKSSVSKPPRKDWDTFFWNFRLALLTGTPLFPMSSSELNSLVYKYLKLQGFEEAAAKLKSKAPSVCRVWSIVWNLVNNVWHWFFFTGGCWNCGRCFFEWYIWELQEEVECKREPSLDVLASD